MMHDAAEKCQWPTLAMYRGFDVFLFLCSLFFFPRLVVREDLFYILQKRVINVTLVTIIYRNISSIHDDPASDGFLKP